MSFYYDHLTGAEAMAWAPELELDRTTVGRVVWGVRTGEWLAGLPPSHGAPRPLPLGDGYHYLREEGHRFFRQDGSWWRENRIHRAFFWPGGALLLDQVLAENRARVCYEPPGEAAC